MGSLGMFQKMMVDLQLPITKLNTVKKVENHGRKSTLIVTSKNAWLLLSKKERNTGLEYPLVINLVLVQMLLLIVHFLLSIQKVFLTFQKTFALNVSPMTLLLLSGNHQALNLKHIFWHTLSKLSDMVNLLTQFPLKKFTNAHGLLKSLSWRKTEIQIEMC